ncbi:FG-GAP repeat domain-containing protein [Mesobacterium pallidum]|uniref:FG-GAP repeat domain-containing protein n=1 Tax=Mesobacterium pallidum TaxID=2872037 RepID=UPI001EE39DF1|nr:VCBS repeat-containing protein [Mesobacterium pallidum]
MQGGAGQAGQTPGARVLRSDGAPRLPLRPWPRLARGALTGLGLWLALLAPVAAAAQIVEARYAEPTGRYAHGVLGDAVEWGALELRLADGTGRVLRLPETRVFEDIAPRLADLDGDGAPEVIVVESDATRGARLAVYGAEGLLDATPYIGQPFRWLAPVGAADLDDDGAVEIAYVDRPHLAKTLRIWRWQQGQLEPVADLPDLTNHRIGWEFIAGGLRDCGAGPEMVLADGAWSRRMAVRWDGTGWTRHDLGPWRDIDAGSGADCR